MSRIRARHHFTTITALAGTLAMTLASTGCTGATKKNIAAPTTIDPVPASAVAAPAQDPMLITLEGALGNRYVPAVHATDIMARLRIDTKTLADENRPPVNLAVAIDTSGSMEGDAMTHARDAAIQLLTQLEDGDRLAVIAFHSTSEVIVPSTELTDGNKDAIAEQIRGMKAMGTTDMAGGLSLALQQLSAHRADDRISRLVLLSDGVPNDEAPIIPLAQNAQNGGITITALGLGLDYNETLLANVAQRSGGSFHYVEEPNMVAGVFRDEVLRLKRLVAQQMTLILNPGPGVTIHEVIGHQIQRATPRIVHVHLGDFSEGAPRDVIVRLSAGSHRDGVNVELLDGILSFTDAVNNAGAFQRRVFLSARSTGDAVVLESGRNSEIAESVESARAAMATIDAVANARAGNLIEAQRILDVATPNLRAIADKSSNARLSAQVDEMVRLRSALPSLSGAQPTPSSMRHSIASGPVDTAEDMTASEPLAPATVRAVHGNAVKTLQGR